MSGHTLLMILRVWAAGTLESGRAHAVLREISWGIQHTETTEEEYIGHIIHLTSLTTCITWTVTNHSSLVNLSGQLLDISLRMSITGCTALCMGRRI